MKKFLLPVFTLVLSLAFTGCETDIKVEELEEQNAAPTPLQLNDQQIYKTDTIPMDVDGTVKASIFGQRDGISFEAPVEAGLFSIEIPVLADEDLINLAHFFNIDEAEIPENIPDDIKLASLSFRVYPEPEEASPPMPPELMDYFLIENKKPETAGIFAVITYTTTEYVYSNHSLNIPQIQIPEVPVMDEDNCIVKTIIDLSIQAGWNKILKEVSISSTSEEGVMVTHYTTRYFIDPEIETDWYQCKLK